MYPGSTAEQPLTKEVKKIMETLKKEFRANFNNVVINRYENGRVALGVHTDTTEALQKGEPIIGLSV